METGTREGPSDAVDSTELIADPYGVYARLSQAAPVHQIAGTDGRPAWLVTRQPNMDPPDHTRIRRLVAQAFTPRHLEQLREPIRRTADALLDAIASQGRA